MNGKGDAPRPTDRARYARNWERIFAPLPTRSLGAALANAIEPPTPVVRIGGARD